MLKTNIENLKKRGFAEKKDIDKLWHLKEDQLISLLDDKTPSVRTSAACLLDASSHKSADALIMLLTKEKCLYTKIAICRTLEKGGLYAAKNMLKHLGKIGNNQHKSLPKKISGKKSFPLPRDIVSRTLSKMDIKIYPVLIKTLCSKDEAKISEVLDAIGYMTFYNKELNTKENAKFIISTAKKYEKNSVIVWKSIVCLSAFSSEEGESFLNEFARGNTVIRLEAKRSLSIIEKRKK